MDSNPFYEFNLLSLSPDDYIEISKFSKECFNEESIFDNASILMYSNQFMDYLHEQLSCPNDEFVRFFLKNAYQGVKTQNVIDKFRPILRKSLNDYIDKIVKEKMTSLVNTSSYISAGNQETGKLLPSKEELEFYKSIQNMLGDLVEISDITYKKTESYFVVLYKNSVRKWLIRIIISNSQTTIIVPDKNKNEVRFRINSLTDVNSYKQYIENALLMYLNPNTALNPAKECLHTKWGTYEMPEPYSIKLTYGPRTDMQPIIT